MFGIPDVRYHVMMIANEQRFDDGDIT